MLVERIAYICIGCDAVYADAPVTSCDCMPDVQGFYIGTISYSTDLFFKQKELNHE